MFHLSLPWQVELRVVVVALSPLLSIFSSLSLFLFLSLILLTYLTILCCLLSNSNGH
jgi:hypothetical protein